MYLGRIKADIRSARFLGRIIPPVASGYTDLRVRYAQPCRQSLEGELFGSFLLALSIHSRMPRRTDFGNSRKFAFAPFRLRNILSRSLGSAPASILSSASQDPFCFAISIARSPDEFMIPRSIAPLAMALLRADQLLPTLLELSRCMVRCSSRTRGRLSIQPQQMASSTISS